MEQPPIQVPGMNGGFRLREAPRDPEAMGEMGRRISDAIALDPSGNPLIDPSKVPANNTGFVTLANAVTKVQIENMALRRVLMRYLHVPESELLKAVTEIGQETEEHLRKIAEQVDRSRSQRPAAGLPPQPPASTNIRRPPPPGGPK